MVKVVGYVNAPCCELFLNGKSLGKREVEKGGHAEWNVGYEVGEIEFVAYNESGEAVAKDKKQTTGKADRLAIKTDFIGEEQNGEKIALLTCYAQDEQGREVPDACPFVEFNADGDGVIVGTGSGVSDHVPPCVADRKMYAGKISVAVRLKKGAKTLKVYARAENLQTGVIELNYNN